MTQTLIEELKLMIEDAGEERLVSASAIESLIEEYKATEQDTKAYICHGCGTITDDPAAYKALLQRAGHLACCLDDKYVPFTHPQPSDETVKDAERYRWLVKNRLLKGVNLTADCTSQFMASGMIGRARSLNGAIDEAMKAERETKAT